TAMISPGMTTPFTLPTLSAGRHLVRVVGTDASGNTGAALAAIDVQPTNNGTPLSFEKNVGQTDSSVDFLTRGTDYTAWLTKQGVTWSAPMGDGTVSNFSMNLVGANAGVQ